LESAGEMIVNESPNFAYNSIDTPPKEEAKVEQSIMWPSASPVTAPTSRRDQAKTSLR
jgi:hypothetical protein|tara:strand:- start:243 stop:416 length:174 start_codon:yes stop_codon:yes gene_type:complete